MIITLFSCKKNEHPPETPPLSNCVATVPQPSNSNCKKYHPHPAGPAANPLQREIYYMVNVRSFFYSQNQTTKNTIDEETIVTSTNNTFPLNLNLDIPNNGLYF